ncbi:MAG TPA: acyl-CoA dehydrogenase family protein [Mycobacteriales bacterium]|nr:acyl-CoA dehydrogenase family protein [Mycobacteriales bacterium]
MELGYTEADEAYRAELRAWLDEHLPDEVRKAGRARFANGGEDTPDGKVPQWSRDWQATLFDHGYLVPPWPRELGGRDSTPVQTLIYHEELARVGAPRTLNFQGLNIVSPSLREFGTPEQQDKWLVRALRGDDLWCIGMSEPGAGSDLGGLSTRGEVHGDTIVLNGQKVWTSTAHNADWCMVYCRTDPDAPKHRGISVVIVDMKTPGVTARPFPHLTGHVDFAEVFFDNAEVPVSNVLGTLHDGWRVTMGALAHERAGLWVGGVANLETIVLNMVDTARARGKLGDPNVRRKIAHLHEQVQTLKCLGYKGFAGFAQASSSPEHSLLKLAHAELQKHMAEAGTLLLGEWGPVNDAPGEGANGMWPRMFMMSLASTIAGGTSEVQRNIIAERVLGLPRA